MLISKALKQTGPESFNKDIKWKEFVIYARHIKKTTVVRQIIAASVILQRGRASPLRQMRWLEYFNKILLGGKAYLTAQFLLNLNGTALRSFNQDNQV